MIKKKAYDNEDIEKERTHSMSFSQDQHAKSFAIFGNNMQNLVNITIQHLKIKGKQSYKKQPYCVICYKSFTTTFRQHHCRVCANAVCGDCSRSMINKERACDLCVMKFSNVAEEKKQKEILETFQLLCAYMVYKKNNLQEELKKLKQSQKDQKQQQIKEEIKKQQETLKALSEENEKMKITKKTMEQELDVIRGNNSKLEAKIMELERQI